MSEADRDDHLDSLRIRRATVLRRSLYRSRAYAVVASIACAAGAAQCAWLVVRRVRSVGFDPRAVVLLVFMSVAVVAAVMLARRAIALNREAASAVLPEPRTRPDFSTLSDGSQRVSNLEDVR